MSTATLTSPVLLRRRLDVTSPRSITELDESGAVVWIARYGSRHHAHVSALAFNSGHHHDPVTGRCEVWPTPGLCVRFIETDRTAAHRLPGIPKQGPKPGRSVLSGRHVDPTRAVA